jgi:hypothetical protein
MRNLLLMFLSISILVGFSEEKPEEFSQSDAIIMVLKEHPEFPLKIGEVKTVEVGVGGPCCDNKVRAELTTEVEKIGKETYIVTLTKDWNFTFSGNYVLSYWKYKVSPNGLLLIDSVNEDELPSGIR